MITAAMDKPIAARAAATPKPPGPFEKPAPGSWALDAQHCEKPVPTWIQDVFVGPFQRGFRMGLESHGALLETIEVRFVNGFLYTCPRPVGAPPEPKGLPPKPVFKLLMALHPGIRKRIKRSRTVFADKPWREEIRLYLGEWMPAIERETGRLLAVPLSGLDDEALARHLADCHRLLMDDAFVHHRMNAARVVPVGDFMAHALRWTGAPVGEALEAMRGSSPESRWGLAEQEALARLIGADAAAAAALRAAGSGFAEAESLLAGLETRRDGIGEAARNWLAKVGHQVTGFSTGYPTLRESPAVLAESLRGALEGLGRGEERDAAAAGEAARERLRRRVPKEHQAAFDALLEEARHVYFVRDHSCMRGTAAFGVARLALMEAGRRLSARGLIAHPEGAMDATQADLESLLLQGTGPSREEMDRRLAWRQGATLEQAPETLGPPPGSPPPADWLPSEAARLFTAVDTYVHAMFDERQVDGKAAIPAPAAAAAGIVVKGLSASGGKRVGTARLVLLPGDFDKVGPGDVLVARLTTPTYNVLLPLLAGIVTDRGGILSHPAIVSREFGIPGVVGARNATALIPDGAKVEIDGDAGTVRVIG